LSDEDGQARNLLIDSTSPGSKICNILTEKMKKGQNFKCKGYANEIELEAYASSNKYLTESAICLGIVVNGYDT